MEAAPVPTESTQNRASLLPIFLIVLVDVLGLTIVIPLLPLYAERFGASALVAALLVPTYAVCQLISGPFLGSLSDRVGRKPVLLVSQFGTFAGFLMIANAHALWLLFVGRVLDGLTAGNLTVAQAYIADNTEAKHRARAFALIGIAFGLGFFLGPWLSGELSRYGLSVPLFLAAGLSALSISLTLLFLRPSAPRLDQTADLPGGRRLSLLQFSAYGAYFARPVVRGILGVFFLYQFAFAMFTSGFALFAERRFVLDGIAFDARAIGRTFAFAGLVSLFVLGGLIGKLVARLGEARVAALGLVSLGVGYTALGYVQPIAPLLVAVGLGAFGNSVLRPALTSLLSQRVTRDEQGVALGLFQSLASLAAISAAPLSGWLIDRGHLTLWGWVSGGCCAAALVVGRRGFQLTRA